MALSADCTTPIRERRETYQHTSMTRSRSSSTRLKFLLVTIGVLPLLAFALSSPQKPRLAREYAQARNVRTRLGHEAALPFYKKLLQDNPNDVTAATRIAQCPDTPFHHDAACPNDPEQIRKLRQLLHDSNYDNRHIRSMFGISENDKLAFASGPVYLTPAVAGSVTDLLNLSSESKDRSLQCLVSLFLLGISVRGDILDECLVGGCESVQLFQDLGLAFPCETDPDLLVPYVHLFPVESRDGNDLILATDLHPRVLSCTTVGMRRDGAVMYIGPDSLALVKHLPLPRAGSLRVLDLCTGSGVQALSALHVLGDNTSNALCVDINERALRFAKFNAALNKLADQVDVQQADLIADTMTCSKQGNFVLEELREASHQMNPGRDSEASSFDVILANPPFIPVPPDDDTILQRYGLFSSGGSDGEDVLKVVVQLASALLPSSGGLLGVVSEFMNPPTSGEGDGRLLGRLQAWWSNGPGGRGVLFTNEFPVDAETYGTRRAGSADERDIWLRHLSKLKVIHVSPGLLFISTDRALTDMTLVCKLVPKSASGSLWTPSNRDAVNFTRKVVETLVHPSNASL